MGLSLMMCNDNFKKDEIIKLLHKKTFNELSKNLKCFIKCMFPKIKNNDYITCEKYHGTKIDCIVKVNEEIKYLSIKTGNTMIILKDNIYNFISKLATYNVSLDSLKSIVRYHFRTKFYEDGIMKISIGSELKLDFKEEIELVREEFKNPYLLSELIDFLLIEENDGKKVDYFYYGDSRIGSCISSDEFKKRIINENNNYPHEFMRIGPFNFISLKKSMSDYNSNFLLKLNNISKYFKKNGV
jgi:hypothetical protein